jgi:hypothetical protein
MGAMDARQGQFVQIRDHERDMILHTWGVPPEILGVIESSNRATITASEYLYSKLVLVPRLELMRGVLQERLAKEWDERLVVDYVSPVERDREFALKVQMAMPGIFTVNEWRELAGDEPLDGTAGDLYPMPDGRFVKELAVADPKAEQEAMLAMMGQGQAEAPPGSPAKPKPKPAAGPEPAEPKDKDYRFVRVRDMVTGRQGTAVLGPRDTLPADWEPLPEAA